MQGHDIEERERESSLNVLHRRPGSIGCLEIRDSRLELRLSFKVGYGL